MERNKMDYSTEKDNAGARIPPPPTFLGLSLIGWIIDQVFPLTIDLLLFSQYIGLALIVGSLWFLYYIASIFKKADTAIKPWKPTKIIIDDGIYAHSRNPMYVAMCCSVVGLGIFLNSYWVLFSFLPSIIIVYFNVVKKEETYLEGKFGQEYLDYKSRVRRWL